jgi:hypothetical protein
MLELSLSGGSAKLVKRDKAWSLGIGANRNPSKIQPPPLYAILVLEWLAFEPLMASWSELNPGLDAVLT